MRVEMHLSSAGRRRDLLSSGRPVMPKIDLPGPYRFHFFSNEAGEPPHVHVKRERRICKFWLKPLLIANNHGFAAHELGKIERLICEYFEEIEAAWNEHQPDHR
jgi:hypothetical protein